VRELLALQASDWPFMVSREIAVPYAHERFDGHRWRLSQALALAADERADVGALRNLAVDADHAFLLNPS
jgi:1,4-alpha-glucan branching enzyme